MNYYRGLQNIFYLTGKYLREDSLSEQLKVISDFNITDFLYSNNFNLRLSPLNYMIPQINGFFSYYGVDASKDSIMILLNKFKDSFGNVSYAEGKVYQLHRYLLVRLS